MAGEPISITDKRGKKYTVSGFVTYRDEGITVPMESLTPEEFDRCAAIWTLRMGNYLNEYYSQHPEEFEKLDTVQVSAAEGKRVMDDLKKRACRPANIPMASAIKT